DIETARSTRELRDWLQAKQIHNALWGQIDTRELVDLAVHAPPPLASDSLDAESSAPFPLHCMDREGRAMAMVGARQFPERRAWLLFVDVRLSAMLAEVLGRAVPSAGCVKPKAGLPRPEVKGDAPCAKQLVFAQGVALSAAALAKPCWDKMQEKMQVVCGSVDTAGTAVLAQFRSTAGKTLQEAAEAVWVKAGAPSHGAQLVQIAAKVLVKVVCVDVVCVAETVLEDRVLDVLDVRVWLLELLLVEVDVLDVLVLSVLVVEVLLADVDELLLRLLELLLVLEMLLEVEVWLVLLLDLEVVVVDVLVVLVELSVLDVLVLEVLLIDFVELLLLLLELVLVREVLLEVEVWLLELDVVLSVCVVEVVVTQNDQRSPQRLPL
ncbi:unnamed protein product, partial [Symbiodinium microadriaticum]